MTHTRSRHALGLFLLVLMGCAGLTDDPSDVESTSEDLRFQLTQDGWNYNILYNSTYAVAANSVFDSPDSTSPETCSPVDVDIGFGPVGTLDPGIFIPSNIGSNVDYTVQHSENRLRSDLRWYAQQTAQYDLRVSAYNYAVQRNLHPNGPVEDPYGLGRALAELAVTGRRKYEEFNNPANWQRGYPSELDIIDNVRYDIQHSAWNNPPISEAVMWWACTQALDHAYKTAAYLMGQTNDRDPIVPAITDTLGFPWTGEYWAASSEDDPVHRPVNVPPTPFPQYSMTVQVTDPVNTTRPTIPIKTRFSIAHAWTRVAVDSQDTLPPWDVNGWGNIGAPTKQNQAGYPTKGGRTSTPASTARIVDYVPSLPVKIVLPYGSGSNGQSSDTTIGNILATYTFPVVAGQTYTVSTCDSPFLTGDTVVAVAGGCEGYGWGICLNDNACGQGSKCVCKATATGTATVYASTHGSSAASWQYTVTATEAQAPPPPVTKCVQMFQGPKFIPCPNDPTPTASIPGRIQVLQQGNPQWSPANVVPSGAPPYEPRRRTVPRAPTPVLEWDAEVIVWLNGGDSSLEESLAVTAQLHKLGLQAGKNYTVLSVDLPGQGWSTKPDSAMFAPWAGECHSYPFGSLFTGCDPGGWTGDEGFPSGTCSTDTHDCTDYNARSMHRVPVLKFTENFVINFLDQLNASMPADSHGRFLKDKLVAVVGGSLGGNLAFRLGRTRSNLNGTPAAADSILPPNVIAWSATAVTPSWGEAGSAGMTLNHAGLKTVFHRAGQPLAGAADLGVETPASRNEFFAQMYDDPTAPFQEPNPAYWYRNNWPCKQSAIRNSRYAKQEYYERNNRLWHWRISGDQTLYSHQAADGDEQGGFNYNKNFRNMLLMAGDQDNHTQYPDNVLDSNNTVWGYTKAVASRMWSTPGWFRGALNTGHSIDGERPAYLAATMEQFLGLKQWNPNSPGASPCLNANAFAPPPANQQVFDSGRVMIGCGGSKSWPTDCNFGYHVCDALEWSGKQAQGGLVPTHHYWVSDALNYLGVGPSSFAAVFPGNGGNQCYVNGPMRVCSGTGAQFVTDSDGNMCNWTGGGLSTPAPKQFFGGCGSASGAGTLCCKN